MLESGRHQPVSESITEFKKRMRMEKRKEIQDCARMTLACLSGYREMLVELDMRLRELVGHAHDDVPLSKQKCIEFASLTLSLVQNSTVLLNAASGIGIHHRYYDEAVKNCDKA